MDNKKLLLLVTISSFLFVLMISGCGTNVGKAFGNTTNITCTNDCSSSGQKICSGNYTKTCGNYDTDSCLEWNSGTRCQYGCANGICNTAPIIAPPVVTPPTQTNNTITGNLFIGSTPLGANVSVDNVYRGVTRLTVINLAVGNHIVKVTKPGYRDYTTTKYVQKGLNTLSVILTRTNQTNSTR